MARLIIGCGYVGERVARKWLQEGECVLATTRSESRANELSRLGILPIVWDWQTSPLPPSNSSAEVQEKLAQLKTVLISVSHAAAKPAPGAPQPAAPQPGAPQPSAQQPSAQQAANAHPAGLQNVSDWLASVYASPTLSGPTLSGPASGTQPPPAETDQGPRILPRWIYLSTTGVLSNSPENGVSNPSTGAGTVADAAPDTSADCLDENTPAQPQRPGATNAANGENWLLNNARWTDRVVLRPTGIYGDDRVPNWRAIRDSVPLEASPESYLNLIHVDDLVSVIHHFSDHQPRHELYCVGDDHPVLRRDYYQHISELGQFPAPVYQPIHPTIESKAAEGEGRPRRTRGNSTKRISSRRLHEELPFKFRYPSYIEGLAMLLPHCIGEA